MTSYLIWSLPARLISTFFVILQILALPGLVTTQDLQAQSRWAHEVTLDSVTSIYGQFVVPNEDYPQVLAPVLANAPEGAYLTVGAERGFIGASLSPQVTDLVFVDRDLKVLGYNIMNTLLLRAARNRHDYLSLRLNAFTGNWRRAFRYAGLSNEEEAFLLRLLPEWERAMNVLLKDFNKKPKKTSDPFFGANYLYDDVLFARVQKLAKSGRIKFAHLNLTDEAELDNLVAEFQHWNTPIAVFDLSNAWWPRYMANSFIELLSYKSTIARIFAAVNQVALDDSILVTTGTMPVNGFHQRGFVRFNQAPLFHYSTFTFDHLRSLGDFKWFAGKIQQSFGESDMPLDIGTHRHNNVAKNRSCLQLLLGTR